MPKSGTSSEDELVLEANSFSGKPRQRKQPVPILKEGKSYIIDPPYPWATTVRATVPSLDYLLSQDITTINGTLQCKHCGAQREVEFDLKDKFYEVARFIVENMETMHQRAPEPWTKPVLPTCEGCGKKKSMKPVITKKRTINWLFLLLGQMLGCCTISQLKYFCKHTLNHKTGAKNRLLYLTYLALCEQLDPSGPFHVSF
ncbi:hypothetical protein SESBI_50714 [Sesbania bispinosa]|nr:hypothetical protein SESBI_50714 [Sesbania bispinosa]